MRFARRSFVTLALSLPLWARGAIAAVVGASRDPLAALPSFLDILIPRDETGSATDFGVDRQLVAAASRNRRQMDLLRAGCQWLEFEAREDGGRGFADLDPASREAVVARAAAARPGLLPRAFFDRTREDALRAYYADPASWKSLGYDGPPQPHGFMDHTEAPR